MVRYTMYNFDKINKSDIEFRKPRKSYQKKKCILYQTDHRAIRNEVS